MKFRIKSMMAVAAIAITGVGTPVAAVDITLSGSVLDSCILTVSTGGALRMENGGTTMSSSAPLGVAAVLAVIATGGRPTVEFAAPTMTEAPGTYAGTPVMQIAYSSLGGADQELTSVTTSYTSTLLLDTVVIHGSISDDDGFVAGDYELTTVATCSQ